MHIVMSFLVAAIGTILAMSLSMQFISSRTSSKKAEVLATRSEAMREVGSVVKSAYDTYLWQQANGLVGCPAGTRVLVSTQGNVRLCWPNANDGCTIFDGWNVCPYAPNWAYQAPNKLNFLLGLTLSSSYAAITHLTPLSGAPAGSVEVMMPTCGDPDTTACMSCADPRTTCWTMEFCVERGTGSCSSDRKISQTYATRRFSN